MSEFGKGLTYCLGLFLAHAERGYYITNKLKEIHQCYPMIWFNGAGDHLFQLQIPDNLPDILKERLNSFQEKVLRWRLAFDVTDEDMKWAIQEAKDLLLEIDKWIGVKAKKGDYE